MTVQSPRVVHAPMRHARHMECGVDLAAILFGALPDHRPAHGPVAHTASPRSTRPTISTSNRLLTTPRRRPRRAHATPCAPQSVAWTIFAAQSAQRVDRQTRARHCRHNRPSPAIPRPDEPVSPPRVPARRSPDRVPRANVGTRGRTPRPACLPVVACPALMQMFNARRRTRGAAHRRVYCSTGPAR
jgi:hypothetical protein